jgi:SAM-dependent methyltransferase
LIDPPDPVTAAALARFYDLDLQDDPGDLDLYLALADRAEGRVLELAAGSGRLAVPLAAAGHPVTAVDIDPAMLERARIRAADAGVPDGRLALVEADLLDLRLPDTAGYAMAFIALNSIMLLASREAQRRALILEWIRPDVTDGTEDDDHLVTKIGSAIHDPATGTITLTAVFEVAGQGGPVRRWVRQDRLRLITTDELAAFAEEAGLRVEVLAGGYDLGPIGPGADRAVLIAERR